MSERIFKWDEYFNTGNDLVDSQHFKLVEIINELLKCSVEEDRCQKNKLIEIKERLSNYVSIHFTTEEALMKEVMIDQRHFEEHTRLHSEFVKEVNYHFNNLDEVLISDKFNEITEYLIRWLAYHILNTDKSMVRQIELIKVRGMRSDQAYEFESLSTEKSTEPLLKALKVLYHLVVKKNREIEKKNNELEQKVKERTAELENANKKLNDMLFEDTLTKLPNRRFVMREIQKLVDNYDRYCEPFSILFIDLDKFKSVNDNYGHEYGDKVLIWVAEFLKSNTRKTDIVCRLGGDEFVVVCSHTDEEHAVKVGEKLNQLCNDEEDEVKEFWKPSLSIGVATYGNHITSPSELLKLADEAMYISKSKGGGFTSIKK